ncbi:MAG: beta strand repeat-containing protein, partial [Planctomycetaceae bacterium]
MAVQCRQLRSAAAFAVSLALAILCAAPARAQIYTWTGTTSTDFNASTNWRSAFTFPIPTNATLRLTDGTTIPNAPTLTASATATSLVFGQASAFSFGSANPAAVLTLTGTTPLSKSNSVTGTIGANIALGGSGTQTFLMANPNVFSGTISGGNAGDVLWIREVSYQNSQTFTHAGNTFASTIRFGGDTVSTNNGPMYGTATVASLGMAGQPSSLGTAGTIVLRNSYNLYLSTTAAAQSSDKSLVLEWINGVNTAFGAGFGLNGGASGFNQGWQYGSVPLNLSGSITAAPIAGWSGTAAMLSDFYTGKSGTLSGVISESASHRLGVTSHGVVLTNPNNSFTGAFTLGVGLFNGTYSLSTFGMSGSPSPIGAGSTIVLTNATRLRYTGAGETSNKIIGTAWTGGGNVEAWLDASGSGELILSNTASIIKDGTYLGMPIWLSGTGRGTLASSVSSTSYGIQKTEAGTWTLTGSNAVPQTSSQGGTLVFAKRVALLGGGTADWVKTKVLTVSGSGAVMGFRVGGADEFTPQDITVLLTNLGGDVSTGGMRSTSSWGFDTTNTGSTFTVNDTIADTSGTGGGQIGLVNHGSGTLALAGTNTFTRGTRIEAGALTITNTAALGSGTAFLNFAGGTLDLANLTLTRNGSVTATAGRLTNGVLTGSAGMTKTGTGVFRIDSTANTFMGATAIQEGVVEAVSVAGPGVASSLGAPLLASSTISLGNAATSGTFRYIGDTSGTMTRVLNLAGTTGGGGIEASGSGALVVPTNALTIAAGAKTLALGGSGTAANTIGAIPDASGGLAVVKDGPGLWQLSAASSFTGQFSVRNGTIVALVDATSGQTNGAFGASGSMPTVLVGDSSAGASGTAAVLMAGGRTTDKVMDVQTGGGSQVVMLGGSGAGTVEFSNNLWLGRPVTLMAATGGTTNFSGFWRAAGGSGTAAEVNVSIGSAGNTGVVSLFRNVATSGTVGVQFGTLRLAGGNETLGRTTPVSIGAATAGATLDVNGRLQTLANLSFTGIGGSVADLAGGGGLALNGAG